MAGVIGTAILTGKASYQAALILDADDARGGLDETPREEFQRKFLLTWRLYLPAAGCACLTITSIVLANQIGTRRAAAIAAAYTLSVKAFAEYREKVIERHGKHDERKVRDSIAKDRVKKQTPSSEVAIIGDGKILCYDKYTSRYFQSTMEDVKKAQNDTNYQIIQHDYASLNDFYNRLGLETVKFGDDVGWGTLDKLEIQFSSVLTELDKPALVIDFYVEPVRNYYQTH